jgi:hypothetical protein
MGNMAGLNFQLFRATASEANGLRTLFFHTKPMGRKARAIFFRPHKVPEFAGDSAWFEVRRAPKRGWEIVRRVDEIGRPYKETSDNA